MAQFTRTEMPARQEHLIKSAKRLRSTVVLDGVGGCGTFPPGCGVSGAGRAAKVWCLLRARHHARLFLYPSWLDPLKHSSERGITHIS